eukprot:CAMPEP_0118964346 /NCGR_PEP_ID=MMETSP1173-20130426/2064_1 /TAXON_ID=1034831 /ORGANISM="Rhizochromulina marina cf, Strain CCMP1243" /LENGTH=894 /DNA_ID=CAMNT_0006912793 /DNA_START=44 /DNA_END=2728 /DNA_ORIENTATION=-
MADTFSDSDSDGSPLKARDVIAEPATEEDILGDVVFREELQRHHLSTEDALHKLRELNVATASDLLRLEDKEFQKVGYRKIDARKLKQVGKVAQERRSEWARSSLALSRALQTQLSQGTPLKPAGLSPTLLENLSRVSERVDHREQLMTLIRLRRESKPATMSQLDLQIDTVGASSLEQEEEEDDQDGGRNAPATAAAPVHPEADDNSEDDAAAAPTSMETLASLPQQAPTHARGLSLDSANAISRGMVDPRPSSSGGHSATPEPDSNHISRGPRLEDTPSSPESKGWRRGARSSSPEQDSSPTSAPRTQPRSILRKESHTGSDAGMEDPRKGKRETHLTFAVSPRPKRKFSSNVYHQIKGTDDAIRDGGLQNLIARLLGSGLCIDVTTSATATSLRSVLVRLDATASTLLFCPPRPGSWSIELTLGFDDVTSVLRDGSITGVLPDGTRMPGVRVHTLALPPPILSKARSLADSPGQPRNPPLPPPPASTATRAGATTPEFRRQASTPPLQPSPAPTTPRSSRRSSSMPVIQLPSVAAASRRSISSSSILGSVTTPSLRSKASSISSALQTAVQRKTPSPPPPPSKASPPPPLPLPSSEVVAPEPDTPPMATATRPPFISSSSASFSNLFTPPTPCLSPPELFLWFRPRADGLHDKLADLFLQLLTEAPEIRGAVAATWQKTNSNRALDSEKGWVGHERQLQWHHNYQRWNSDRSVSAVDELWLRRRATEVRMEAKGHAKNKSSRFSLPGHKSRSIRQLFGRHEDDESEGEQTRVSRGVLSVASESAMTSMASPLPLPGMAAVRRRSDAGKHANGREAQRHSHFAFRLRAKSMHAHTHSAHTTTPSMSAAAIQALRESSTGDSPATRSQNRTSARGDADDRMEQAAFLRNGDSK